jgi:hypothetical protein
MNYLQLEIESLEIDIEELEKQIKSKRDLLKIKRNSLYNPSLPIEILSELVPLSVLPSEQKTTIMEYQNKVRNETKYGI